MKKYLTVFSLSFQNEFTYRLNFILWRFRNVLRVLMSYYLWSSIFATNVQVFGYSKGQMMAYLILALFIASLVAASPSNDNIGGEISNGTLNNFLMKPIGYLHYWFTRDIASKVLNMVFAVGEISLLYVIFRPVISITSDPILLAFSLSLTLSAIFIFFFLTKLAISSVFWAPENTWGFMFLILVLFEMLAGLIFPLDLLPHWAYSGLQFTPFPYLIYFPLATLTGQLTVLAASRFLIQSLIWVGILFLLLRKIWRAGLRNYSAYGG